MKIEYNTRDGKGNDIIKEVEIKEYEPVERSFLCRCCGRRVGKGIPVKKIVSSNFTDWALVGDYVCEKCANLFSVYFYNYVVDPDGIHLYNVREIGAQLTREQKPPYLFVISTTQKKHLFYRAKWNYGEESFAVNLETETIYTTRERMAVLLGFVESMQTLGAGKNQMKEGRLPFEVLKKTGMEALEWLNRELKTSREIQIPLYCGQKREITEDEALCCITSIVKT